MSNEFSELKSWIQGYLHQDFDVVHGSVDDALIAYKNEASSEEIEKLKHDLEEITQSNHDEETLKNLLLTQFDCYYYYPSEWTSAKNWIRHLQEVLGP